MSATAVAGVCSDPGHVLAYPQQQEGIYQQLAVCFHAVAAARDARPDHEETTNAGWFAPEHAEPLSVHPAMRQRLTNAVAEPHRALFD